MRFPPLQYRDYLQLDKLLAAQQRRSEQYKAPAHDEMLFIVVHQAFELWFKQMLFELDSVLEIMAKNPVPEKNLGLVVARLDRIVQIQKFVLGQIDILETMSPMDFLDFREFLYPASGFQSLQWRMIETKLGLKEADRLRYSEQPFWKSLHPSEQATMQMVMQTPSFAELIEAWLERTPFVRSENFDFWQQYQDSVKKMLEQDIEIIRTNPRLDEQAKDKSLRMMEQTLSQFNTLFDPAQFAKAQQAGTFKMSQAALLSALFILVYREEPLLQLPAQVLRLVQDLDETMTNWRYRHALMAKRMLGQKIGTGGSSGHEYLKSAAEHHRLFSDLTCLASFLLPTRARPPLPSELQRQMNFSFTQIGQGPT